MSGEILSRVLSRVARSGSKSGVNLVAFSGGVDSSLVAYAVHRQFPHNSYVRDHLDDIDRL